LPHTSPTVPSFVDPGLHTANGGGHFCAREASEEQRLPRRSQASAKTGLRGSESSAWGVSKESHSQRLAHASGGLLGAAYARFLRMPVAVVLTVLWVLGMVLLSSGVLTLYALGTLLASVVAGA
jgi:hypothetical protein